MTTIAPASTAWPDGYESKASGTLRKCPHVRSPPQIDAAGRSRSTSAFSTSRSTISLAGMSSTRARAARHH